MDARGSCPVRAAVVLGIALFAASPARADAERRVYATERAAVPPVLDGRVDDAAWQAVEWSSGFVQREPADGKPPTYQTQFKVLYDDAALYFAFKALDASGRPNSQLARRDRFPGDWVEVNIDSYADRRTAFSFTLSLSGSRGDEFISNDGDHWDANWDPVWEGATDVGDDGWTAEMKIPLSQLRFSAVESQTWGLQVQRRIFSREERSTWQPIPKDVSGWVSRFGELRGLEGIKPRRRVELLPYAVTKAERFDTGDGNPFREGTSAALTGGLDAKLGITSDLTLDATVNPDFGQVEADPSEVNLTAFETFFEEKRPFFVEGNNIFDLRLAPAITGGHFTSDRLFYSRRIGGRPPYSPDLGDGEFADEPLNTSILGAAKLSGKTPGGLSIGVLDSLTSSERAEIDSFGQRRRVTVAPFSNYFAGRLQQDLRGGDTQIGLMATAANRSSDEPQLRFLTSQAYGGALDFAHYLGDRAYLVEANLLASHVRGSREALAEVQTSAAHYFQRPDNHEASLDPERTSLGGHAGSLRLSRTKSNTNFRFQTGAAWRSPGFEINDLGFMQRADEVNQFGWAAYQVRNPFSVFRRLEWNVNEWLDWDFGGRLLRRAFNTNAHAQFLNNYRIGGSLTRQLEGVSNTELRGGPSSRWPGTLEYQAYMDSDQRKKVFWSAGIEGLRGDENSERTRKLWLDLSWRPANALSLTLSPSLSRTRRELQYVDTQPYGSADRYLFGSLVQETAALTVRLDFAITPDLTVQYYGAPFASSGNYAELKRVTDPQAAAYGDRFSVFSPDQIALGAARGTYHVDENRDGQVDYSFDRPDFDVREFNSTLVVRWEYRPGSMLYVVWSQARDDDAMSPGGVAFGRGLRETFRAPAHDVFLIKFSKWFSL